MRSSHARIVGDVRKIAVLRANALGDFIFTLPALEALRHAYPDAQIVLLARRWHAEFLRDRPGPVDRVVVVPPIRGLTASPEAHDEAMEVDRFIERMRDERFDLALQLHGGGRFSNPFVARLGARITAGFGAPDATALDRTMPYTFFQNERMRQLEAVALVGAVAPASESRLAVTARDVAEADAMVPRSGAPLVVLQPGATDPRRRWPAERFAAVGVQLARAGARIAINGSDEERDLVAAVQRALPAPAIDVAGLSLSGLAGLLSRTRLIVSNDTGPLHLAQAVGAATVGIYWAINALCFTPFTRTRHRCVISWQLDCSVCGMSNVERRCAHDPSFVAAVRVGDVAREALDLLVLDAEDAPSSIAGSSSRPAAASSTAETATPAGS